MAIARLTLRVRLVATTTVAALVAVGVLVVGVQVLLAHVTRTESINALRDRADAAVTTVRGTPQHPRVLDVPADSLDQNLWIYDVRGTRIDGDAPSPGLARAVASLGRVTRESSRVVSGRYRLLAIPARGRGQGPVVAVVVAGVDLTPYESSERRGLWLSLALGALIVVAAGTASWAAATYSLRRVRQMARRADEWREHDLSGRFALGPPREELTELAQTLDRMLDRISRAITTERRLTDEVAHELRTPLTAIRSEAELALLDSDVPDPTRRALVAVVNATEQMNQSISTILTVARSAHADNRSSTTVAAVLDEVNHRVARREDVTVTLRRGSRAVALLAPQAVVVAALTPLVDNAVRHARTAVTVEVRTEPPRVQILVEDDGDGVRAEETELVFSPGYTSTDDGAGLGLALARRLTHSVGGVVRAEACGKGRFVIDLPGA